MQHAAMCAQCSDQHLRMQQRRYLTRLWLLLLLCICWHSALLQFPCYLDAVFSAVVSAVLHYMMNWQLLFVSG
jgi:hypothetical protein